MPQQQRTGLLLLLGAAGAIYLVLQQRSSDPPTAKEIGTSTRRGLLGSTRTRDFVAETRSALAGQSSFIAARVTRAYVHTQGIRRSILWIASDATTVITYSAEYSLGFDLRPGEFDVTADAAGITLTVRRPHLVAAPAVRLLSHDIPDRGFFVDEEQALIELQQSIQPMVERRAAAIEEEPAVVAQCEQALRAFLRTLLSRHGPPPAVRFAYR